MKKLVLAGLLLFITGYSFGSPDTLRLFYSIDVHRLSDQDKEKVKAIFDSIANDQPITIKGYADYLGSKPYNQALSERRANEIRAYLLLLGSRIRITSEGEGQVTEAGKKGRLGEPRDRRVDIIFSKIKPIVPVAPAMANFSNKVDSLSSLDVGKSISLDELLFEGGRHILERESQPYLLLLTRYLAEHKNIYFEIRGHVCCEDPHGRDGYDFDARNYNLSLNRARAIYQYFVQNGIDTARMKYTGVGASQPRIAPEVTEGDRQRNRRVEIIILKK